jgi:tetratricopeptide (TPR) repeat protein
VPQITSEQVEGAIPNALEASRNTLEWLWGGLGPAQRVVASALAAVGQKSVTNDELERILRESGVRILVRELQDAPQLLQDWDILEPVDGGYSFRVELLRRWLAEFRPLNRVQREIDRIQPVAENLFQAASGFYESSDLAQAKPLLMQAIRLNPNHVRANELLGEILISEGKYADARELLEKLLEFAPNAARGRLIQVYQAQAQNSTDDKVKMEFFEKVLGLDPSNPEAQSSILAFNKLEQEEKDLAFRFIEGRQALQKGEWKRAQESFRWVVSIRPDYSYDSQFVADLLTDAVRLGISPPPFWKVWIRNPQIRAFLGGAILLIVLVFFAGMGSSLVSLGRENRIGPFAALAPTFTSTSSPTSTPSPTITPNSILVSNQVLIDLSRSEVSISEIGRLVDTLSLLGYESEGSKSFLAQMDLSQYKLIIILGNKFTSPYTEEEALFVENYVNTGGALILVSDDQPGDHPEYLQRIGVLFGLESLNSNSNSSCTVSQNQDVLVSLSSITLDFAGRLQVDSNWDTVCEANGEIIIAARDYGFGSIISLAEAGIMYSPQAYEELLVTELVQWVTR